MKREKDATLPPKASSGSTSVCTWMVMFQCVYSVTASLFQYGWLKVLVKV